MQFRKALKMQLSPGDTFRRQDMKILLIVIKSKNLVNCSGNAVDVDRLNENNKLS